MIAYILAGIYGAGTLLFTGWFVGDEMRFRNPEYGWAVLYAVMWPFLLLNLAVRTVWERGSA